MFLDMLTADAASRHGHEFSEPQQVNRWLGARRSPLRVLPYATRPREPTRSRSVRGTMGELKEVPEELDLVQRSRYHDISVIDLHVPGSFQQDSPPTSPSRQSISEPRRDAVIVQSSPKRQSSQQPPSLTATDRSHRPKTQFSVAVPPPCALPLRKQGIARPRALFQLQTQVDSKFHRPIYELIPLSRIDGSRKVGQLIRRLGKAKENITNEDLAVVRVENYNTSGLSKDSSDTPETREILGIISPCPTQVGFPAGKAQIFLDGAVWNATPGRDGRYDLQCVGTEHHSARWYIPKSRRKHAENMNVAASDRKLYFAAILPHTTKHPTLASLNKTHLDIYDWYTLNTDLVTQDILTPLESSTPATQISQSSYWSQQQSETSSTMLFNVPIDELHRKLIVVSSFWAMLCEGWSSYYTFPIASASGSLSSTPVDRTMSLPMIKDDKLVIPGLNLPPSAMATRQVTPERQPVSATSPAPSVATEDLSTSSKRLSLSSFNFRRSSTSTTIASRSKTSDQAVSKSSITTSQTDQSSLSNESRAATIASVARVTSPSVDLTTQSHHATTSENEIAALPTRPPASRLGSMVRRISSNNTPEGGNSRRNRSISWRWNRTTSQQINTELVQQITAESRSEAVTNKNMSSDVASVEASMLLSEGHPGEVDHNVPVPKQISTTSASCLSDLESSLYVKDVYEGTSSFVSNDSPRNPSQSQPIEAGTNQSHDAPDYVLDMTSDAVNNTSAQHEGIRRWSTSSNESTQMHVGRPYWRDFDRLQMNAFWQNAPNVLDSTVNQRDPNFYASVYGDEADTDEIVMPSIEGTDAVRSSTSSTLGTAFFESVRQTLGMSRYRA